MKKFSSYLSFRNLSLVAVLLIAIWAFWPPSSQTGARQESSKSTNASTGKQSEKKYVLKIYPGSWYLPGTVYLDVGKPVENLNHVAEKFEALYPDTKIEYVGVPIVREWLVTQLSAGLAPDILSVNVEDVWQDVHKGWYLPLDEYLGQPNPFVKPGDPGSEQWWDVFKYQAITRGKAAPDHKMYCITLDMIETGIFYNKDIFSKLHLDVPRNWSEFIEVQKKLKAAGYIPFLGMLEWMTDWGVDLVFDQLYKPIVAGIDLVGDPVRAGYLKNYLDWDEISFLHQKGFFAQQDQRYVELWRILKDWRQYWNKDMASSDVNRLFITKKGAMLWNASMLVQKLEMDPQMDFEWGIFYPPPIDNKYNSFCDGHEMCVIGGAATQLTVTNSAVRDTGDPKTSERLKRCIAFLQFLTTPENAEAVVNEIVALLPNVKGVEPHQSLLPFDEILRKPYTMTKWYFTFDQKFNEVMMRMLDLYINNGIAEDKYLEWTQRNLDAAIAKIVRRKNIDFSGYEEKWKQLEPLRKNMKGLPPGAN